MKKWHYIFLFVLIFLLIVFLVFSLKNNNKNIEYKLPDKLNNIVAQRSEQLIQRAKEKGINVIITDGFRSIEEQNLLYEQGRSTEGDIVTRVKGGQSYHNYGLAIDFVILNKKKQPKWDLKYDGNGNGKSDWMEVVDIAKELGFTWGGDWETFKDYPHLQMDFGLSIYELKTGKRRPPE